MFLEKLTDVIAKQEMTIPVASPLQSQTVRISLDRSYPLEKIFIVCSAVVNAVIATPSADGLLALIRKVTLEVNGGTKPRKVVDASGADLVELAAHEQLNLDRGTQAAFGIQASGTGKNIAASVVRFVIPINLASPVLVDPLKTLFLLPVQNHPNDAVLTIETGTQADVDKNGAPTFVLTSFSFEVVTVRRLMPRWYNQQIISEGGYVDYDMLASSFDFPNSGEQKIDIPAPGYYFNLLLRHFTTASARADISAAGNDLWRLEVQNSVMRRFRMTHVENENDHSRNVVATLSAALTLVNQSAGVTGAMAFLDFLSDETGADVNELGSVLDTTLPQAAGQKSQLIGTVTGGAAVKLRIIGRRALDDISRFQVVRGKTPGT